MNEVECSYCKKYLSYANINRHEYKYCKRNPNSLSFKNFMSISQLEINIIENSKLNKEDDNENVESSKVPTFSDFRE